MDFTKDNSRVPDQEDFFGGAAHLPDPEPDPKDVRRILVIKLRHHGDVLLATPLLTTLGINYVNALIDVLVYEGTDEILTGNTAVYLAYAVDRGWKHAGIKARLLGEKALFNSLRTWRYDLIINLSDQWRSALYCLALKPRMSLAFHYPKRDCWFWRYCHTRLVDNPLRAQLHTVMNNLQILAPLKLRKISTRVNITLGAGETYYIEQLRKKYNVGEYILIHPAARWLFKTWSPSSFSRLINHLTARGETVIITSGPEPAGIACVKDILARCDQAQRLISLAGKLRLPELAVLIARARLFIGVDSAPMHMAAALKTPAVVLFGPSNLAQWRPWQAPHTLIWAGDYRVLPHPDRVATDTTERYLDAIPVNDVINAVDRWLTPGNQGPSGTPHAAERPDGPAVIDLTLCG
ncbi:putative lipopolysaccharide heptosyltransferase III [Acerihabitans arboris]|uniref:Putative lipopolysaccharide heptosyltransferase III n=1 Tax=Acerihabitans arboris TaxID=2691583 RepID=A0A845SGS7_9GAMM|nr:putative lipopolysaccharide heptosyltransferase III [Acerihabitans arboris]NDL64070.1 putative lipopolysaccharide heptosyltransferase III [Acerihabitans arboris]